MNPKLGVIGGLGTDTAAQFYIEAEKLWHDSGQSSHIPFVLENVQSPYELEQSLVCDIKRIGELRSFLCQAARNLESSGADLIVIPCNTAHVHLQAIRDSVTVPVISITESVAQKLKSQGVKTAAILGTSVTRNSGIYDVDCQKVGITTTYPSQTDQKIIERIIQRLLSWQNDETDNIKLAEVIQRVLTAGAERVVLACTDLQLCLPKQLPDHIIDSMKELAEVSISALAKDHR